MESNYRNEINNALKELSSKKDIPSAFLLCNTLLGYMGIEIKEIEDIELSKLRLPNAERYDGWFEPHPHFRDARACFDLTPEKSETLEIKFYALRKRSRLCIAGAASFTPNFEDRDYTRKDPNMKVGIDFFLTPEKDSVIVVLSNKGSLRLVELSGRLTNTQNDIFTVWRNIAYAEDKNTLHTAMWESFKLSSLNKKFYEGISNSFISLTQHLHKNNVDEQLANQFASRLHGRILFLWFLRKKNVINESKNYFDIGDKDDNSYYENILSELFFNVLNNENHKDFDPITPYLNGGLFDQNSDGEYWNTHKPTFPTGFFKTLYDHFDSFNFTTDESTPEYEQIAIDPEMLGRIFESFLATLTTETGAQAKKANGAFYTPREIVSYMSRESLRQYLYTTAGEEVAIKKTIDELLDRTDSDWATSGNQSKNHSVTKDNREKILNALRNIRVLDPAVGSGAFPMGVLHKILSIFERLEPNFDSYETKLAILRNNIYGVDIDPTAIEISRLRAWLSIIVDVKDIKKIKPLPNLDFKFVCANTLIGLEVSKQESLIPSPDLKSNLIRIRDEYYATSNKAKKEKLQKEYIKLTHKNSLFDIEETRQLKSYQPFENGKSASFYDPELMHGVESFDVVIGNPPYVGFGVRGSEKISKIYKKKILDLFPNSAEYKINLYPLFMEKAFNLCNDNGVESFIVPDSFLLGKYFSKIRKYILHSSQIVKILLFSEPVFDAVVGYSVVYIFKKTTKPKHDVDVIKVRSSDLSSIKPFKYSQNTFSTTLLNRFRLYSNILEKELVEKIEEQPKKIADLLDFKSGLISNIGQKEIICDTKKNEEWLPGVISGGEVSRYSISWQGNYIRYNKKFIKSGYGNVSYFEDKIFVRQTGDKIISAFDDVGYLCLNNVHVGNLVNKIYEPFTIIAILNSKLINKYYEIISLEKGRVMAQIDIDVLKSIPVPIVSKKEESDIKTLVNKIIVIKKTNSLGDIKNLEAQIDQLVYKLYDLTPEEIEIIENSSKK
ncbi:MAG: TaqI-like C-terminal specificity domain-containing protein [Candidatus Paceibacterota bacterium]